MKIQASKQHPVGKPSTLSSTVLMLTSDIFPFAFTYQHRPLFLTLQSEIQM